MRLPPVSCRACHAKRFDFYSQPSQDLATEVLKLAWAKVTYEWAKETYEWAKEPNALHGLAIEVLKQANLNRACMILHGSTTPTRSPSLSPRLSELHTPPSLHSCSTKKKQNLSKQ